MSLASIISQCEMYIGEIKQVSATLGSNPSPLLVLFPIVYKKYIAGNEKLHAIDQRLLTFGGMYLTSAYPQLRPYFMTPESREQLEQLQAQFTKVLEES
jgi:hypothetical protein